MPNTPWRTQSTNYEPNMGDNAPVVIVDKDGKYVCQCGWPGAPKTIDEMNAAAIVRAVNAAAQK